MKKYLFFLICLQMIGCQVLLAKDHDFLETREEYFRASPLDPLEVFIDDDVIEKCPQ